MLLPFFTGVTETDIVFRGSRIMTGGTKGLPIGLRGPEQYRIPAVRHDMVDNRRRDDMTARQTVHAEWMLLQVAEPGLAPLPSIAARMRRAAGLMDPGLRLARRWRAGEAATVLRGACRHRIAP